jgi:Uncharacterized protein conserved in bacteria
MKKILIEIKNYLLKNYWRVKRTFIVPKIPINKDGKIYINLGSGNLSGNEYINIDSKKLPRVHYIQDIENLSNFLDESVDMIYACHVVEHIPRFRLIKTLREWRRVLKKEGVFRFAVPNFDSLIDIYNASDKNIRSVENQIMGQNAPYDNHCSIWNKKYAEDILIQAGFKTIKEWDYKNADHHDFNDKSSRIMTVGNKSIPISLNLEAKK